MIQQSKFLLVIIFFVSRSQEQEAFDFFHFRENFYEGSIDRTGKLSVENIVFDERAYTSEVSFHLTGTDSEFFLLEQANNVLQLSISSSFFQNGVSRNKNFIILELVARQESSLENSHVLEARTIVVLSVPVAKKDAEPPNIIEAKQPAFQKPLYEGVIKPGNELELEDIILNIETYEDKETKFELTGNQSGEFQLTTNRNRVRLVFQGDLNLNESQHGGNMLLVLSARNGKLKAYAAIVLRRKVPETSLGEADTKIFDSAWFMGSLALVAAGRQELRIQPIGIASKGAVDAYEFMLEGDEAQNFGFTVNPTNSSLNIRLLNPLNASVLEQKTQLNILLTAVHKSLSVYNATAWIFIGLPPKDCPVSSLNPSSIPQFDSSEFTFTAHLTHGGSLGRISAAVRDSNASAQYFLKVDEAHLVSSLSIDKQTGELVLLSRVNPASYNFLLRAENVESLDAAEENANLIFAELPNCVPTNETVTHALIIKYIEEEMEHKNLFNTTFSSNCRFEIMEIMPNDLTYVYIDATSNMLNTIAIDREAEIFHGLTEPEIEIKLKLRCNNNNQPQKPMQKTETLQFPHDIPYSSDITILRLIVLDINDHAPEFITPNASSTILGYPERSICFELFPEYLIQVQAIDKDVGANAAIRYAIQDNMHFNIDAETGIIYPKARALAAEQSVDLLVTAVDNLGESHGLRTVVTLVVKSLSRRFFSLLTFEADQRQSMVEVFSEISRRSTYSIKALKYATLAGGTYSVGRSSLSRKRSIRIDEQQRIVQKAWTYGFNARGEPIECEELENILNANTVPMEHLVSVDSYNVVGLISNRSLVDPTADQPNSEEGEDKSNLTYLVIIIVLSTVCVIAVGLLLWQCYIYKRKPVAASQCTSQLSVPSPTYACALVTKPAVSQSNTNDPTTCSGNSTQTNTVASNVTQGQDCRVYCPRPPPQPDHNLQQAPQEPEISAQLSQLYFLPDCQIVPISFDDESTPNIDDNEEEECGAKRGSYDLNIENSVANENSIEPTTGKGCYRTKNEI